MIKISLKNLLLVLIFFGLGFFYFSRIKKEPIKDDEHFFVTRAEFFDLYFLKRDFKNELWNGFYGVDHPNVSAYYYGIVLRFQGIRDIRHAFKKVNWDQLYPGQDYRGRPKKLNWTLAYMDKFPPPELQDKFDFLAKVRIGAVVALLAATALFYITLKKTIGFWWGVIGVLLFALNPITRKFAVKALGDQLLLFFLLLTPILTCWLSRLKSIKRLIIGFIVMGINCGLAMGTKLNGGVTIVFYWFFALLYSWAKLFKKKSNKIDAETILWNMSPIIVGLTAGLLFWALHPIIWNVAKNPFLGFYYFVVYRWKIVELQVSGWLPDSLIGNWFSRLTAFTHWLFYLPLKIDVLAFLLGLVTLSKKLFVNLKEKKLSEQSIFILWNLVLLATCYFYIVLSWDRYYFILVPTVVFFQLYGLVFLKEFFISKKK